MSDPRMGIERLTVEIPTSSETVSLPDRLVFRNPQQPSISIPPPPGLNSAPYQPRLVAMLPQQPPISMPLPRLVSMTHQLPPISMPPLPRLVSMPRQPRPVPSTPDVLALPPSASLHLDTVKRSNSTLSAIRLERHRSTAFPSNSVRTQTRNINVMPANETASYLNERYNNFTHYIIHKHIQIAYRYARDNTKSIAHLPMTESEETTPLSTFGPFANHCRVCSECGHWHVRKAIKQYLRISAQFVSCAMLKTLYAHAVLGCKAAQVEHTLRSFNIKSGPAHIYYDMTDTEVEILCSFVGNSSTGLEGHVRCVGLLSNLTSLCFDLDIHYSPILLGEVHNKNIETCLEVCGWNGCQKRFSSVGGKFSDFARHRKEHRWAINSSSRRQNSDRVLASACRPRR